MKKKEIKKEVKIGKMPDHIDEYFVKIEGNKEAIQSRELFKADKDVDLKTDLTGQEIAFINVLMFNDEILRRRKIKPIFNSFLNSYMRLKFSLDRKSRGEFVSINKSDDLEGASQLASNLSSITGSRK